MKRYFGTDGIRGVAGELPMTAAFALHVGIALAEVFKPTNKDPVKEDSVKEDSVKEDSVKEDSVKEGRIQMLIGCDTRRSSDMLTHAVAAGLCSRGVDVQLLGVVPTPAVSYLTRTTDACAGVVISASHNPFEQNGIKVFNAQGGKLTDDVEQALEDAIDASLQGQLAIAVVTGKQVGRSSNSTNLKQAYLESLNSTGPSLDGLKIALDCANGACFETAPQIFEALGAHVTVLNNQPNGDNINVACGSTHPAAFQAFVKEGTFDVGITFDGDADRAMLVDSKGRLVTGDYILALCALARGETTVVSTVMANLGLEHFLSKHNINLLRTKVGDRYVHEALEAGELTLGGEQSGHILFLDQAPTGDGVLTALQTLAAVQKLGEPLEHWLDAMPLYPQTLVNVPVDATLKADIAEHALVRTAVEEAETELSGWGRINLRPSGTEPLVRVMVEGSDATRMHAIAERVAAAVARVA
ncbi:MAG: phosphoglucosamine mutase [Deinococcota bacterium]